MSIVTMICLVIMVICTLVMIGSDIYCSFLQRKYKKEYEEWEKKLDELRKNK